MPGQTSMSVVIGTIQSQRPTALGVNVRGHTYADRHDAIIGPARRRPPARRRAGPRPRRCRGDDHAGPSRAAQRDDAHHVAHAGRDRGRAARRRAGRGGEGRRRGVLGGARPVDALARWPARGEGLPRAPGAERRRVRRRDRGLPGGLRLAGPARPGHDRAGPRLRDRGRLPARAGLRPPGGRRRRAVLHEGAGTRPGARPRGNKTAGQRSLGMRGRWRSVRPRATSGPPRPRRSDWPRSSYPARSWTPPSPTSPTRSWPTRATRSPAPRHCCSRRRTVRWTTSGGPSAPRRWA